MSFYVEVPEKEKWLRNHGREISKDEAKKVLKNKEEIPIALVSTNDTSEMAVIAYCDGELATALRDKRPTKWFAVSKRKANAFIKRGR